MSDTENTTPKAKLPGHYVGARITDEQYEAVRSAAKAQGVKVAAFVRAAVTSAAGVS